MDAEAYADMLPWLVFVVVDRRGGLGVAWASGAGLVCGAGLLGWSYWRGRYAPLPRVAIAVFGACLAMPFIFSGWDHQIGPARGLAVGLLGAVLLVSLFATPLSEAYTTPLVAPDTRGDARFRRVNVEMTFAWGLGAMAVAAACGSTALSRGPFASTLLDWVMPLVLAACTILWAARRWELFRLAVDGASTDADRVMHRVTALSSENRALQRVSPLREVSTQGAMIHHLPVGHRRHA